MTPTRFFSLLTRLPVRLVGFVLAVPLLATGCTVFESEVRIQGVCTAKHPDCAPGQYCDLDQASCLAVPDGGIPAGLTCEIRGTDRVCWQPDGGAILAMDAPAPDAQADAMPDAEATPDAFDCRACGDAGLCEADAGRCVQCLTATDCPAATPQCDPASLTCGLCTSDETCIARGDGRSHCDKDQGVCVACLVSAHCTSATAPVCDPTERTCRGCRADVECVGGATPGVCVTADGHCATDAETAYVQKGTCPGVGTAAMPACDLQQGLASGKPVVVVRGPQAVGGGTFAGPGDRLIVGQNNALVAGGANAGLVVTGGAVTVRGLTLVSSATDPGVIVSGGATLMLDASTVRGNAGGGIRVDGGKLQVSRTLVTANGMAGAAWGGVLLNNAAAGTTLERVSITANKAVGVLCLSAASGNGVQVTDNTSMDISGNCGFSSCGTPSPTCGAPP